MYVDPEFRSAGVGKMLIDAVKEFSRAKNWLRIDVTAPPEQQWTRTVRFYEKQGFVFTGPKMRFKF
jgi:GNAT superfamily N-acetyltransferase